MEIGNVFWAINVIGNLKLLLSGVTGLFFISYLFLFLVTRALQDETPDHVGVYEAKFRNFLKYFVLLVFINIVLPNEESLYMMLGGRYLSDQNMSPKIKNAIEHKLEFYLK